LHNILKNNENVTYIKDDNKWNIGKEKDFDTITSKIEEKIEKKYEEESKKLNTPEADLYFSNKFTRIKKKINNKMDVMPSSDTLATSYGFSFILSKKSSIFIASLQILFRNILIVLLLI
jgi:hypothetical protein